MNGEKAYSDPKNLGTPANIKQIQEVITNLLISRIEARLETDSDVSPYLHSRQVEVITISLDETLQNVKKKFEAMLRTPVDKLVSMNLYYERNLEKGAVVKLLKAREAMRKRPGLDANTVASAESNFALAMTLYHAYDCIQNQGLGAVFSSMNKVDQDAKSSSCSRYKRDLVQTVLWKETFQLVESSIAGAGFEQRHPKISALKQIIQRHFGLFSSSKKGFCGFINIVLNFEFTLTEMHGDDTRVMVFAQIRDTVQ